MTHKFLPPVLLLLAAASSPSCGTMSLAEYGAYNVRDYGAQGDGIADDTAAIQDAIDAAADGGGGVVFFPRGRYNITAALLKKADVSLEGEAMLGRVSEWTGSILTWGAVNSGTMVDTTNEALDGTFIRNLKFQKTTTASVTGVLGGSTSANYNSSNGTFENLRFYSINYPIRGDGASDIGIFDSLFSNVVIHSAHFGLWMHGSGNVVIHPKLVNCDTGIVLDWLSAESMAGVQVIGGVFGQNNYDISVPSQNGIRPCGFRGTWFERSAYGVLNIPASDTRLMSMLFNNCMLSTDFTPSNNAVINFFSATGAITLHTCTIWQGTVGGTDTAIEVTGPQSQFGQLKVRNTATYTVGNSNPQFRDDP